MVEILITERATWHERRNFSLWNRDKSNFNKKFSETPGLIVCQCDL